MTELDGVLAYLESRPYLHITVAALGLLAAAMVGNFFVKYVLRRIVHTVAPKLGAVTAELVLDEVLLKRLALFVPALIIYQGAAFLPGATKLLSTLIQKGSVIAAIIIGLGILSRISFKINDIYSRFEISRSRPIKGYLQVATIGFYILGFIICIATAMDKSPLVFLSGLGAMTAIIMLVFRDTLLSLVAGVQLTANDVIRVGDWIEMPQFGADGFVIDIALHVVKVQNWDKTITVIPAHKFLENSFKNWRGMTESGGRRIKRSFYVDVTTIRFLEDEEIKKFGTYALLKDYIHSKTMELADYNRERLGAGVLVANARRLTNIGTLRAYVSNYLRQHPGIHQDMTFLVRQLQPTSEGLPIEIYVFTKDTRWAHYEGVQADIFDHILAVIQEFGLRIYQKPSGNDLHGLEIPSLRAAKPGHSVPVLS